MMAENDKYYRARILDRRDLAPDLWVVRVDPGGKFAFKPGQYATLGVVAPEKHYERAYSIAAAPHEGFLEFFIELVPQGVLTPRIHPYQPGDVFTLRKSAKGLFTLNTNSGRTNHLLIATVTGVAPFVSYVRSLHRQWQDKTFAGEHKLFLLDGASRSWELAYREELARYAAEVPWFTYVPTVSRLWEDPSWKGETGRVDDVVRKYTDSWGLTAETTCAYLCGHPTMLEHTKGILKRRGWQKDAMKEEVYYVPSKQAAAT